MHTPAETPFPDWSADFCRVPDWLTPWARLRPDAIALSDDQQTLTWRSLVDRVQGMAAALQAQGLRPHEPVAMLGRSNAAQLLAYLAVVVAGGVAVPLPQLATPAQWASMLANCGARWLFADADLDFGRHGLGLSLIEISTEGHYRSEGRPWGDQPGVPTPANVTPGDPFNIIYSSGTTGEPKGIVQPHLMRWMHVRRAERYQMTTDSAAVLQHHSGGGLARPGRRRPGAPSPQVQRGGLPRAGLFPSRYPHHAGASAVPAPDGRLQLR